MQLIILAYFIVWLTLTFALGWLGGFREHGFSGAVFAGSVALLAFIAVAATIILVVTAFIVVTVHIGGL